MTARIEAASPEAATATAATATAATATAATATAGMGAAVTEPASTHGFRRPHTPRRGPISGLAEFLAEQFARHEIWFLAAVTAAYLAVLIFSASHRPFWFDELSTVTIASVPGIAGMLRALPTDGNPPLEFLLVKLSIYLFGTGELAVRLPSIVAMTAAVAAVYCYTRRRVEPVFALLAAALLAGSEAGRYAATEARPYALMLAFTGLTLVSWQAAAQYLPGTRAGLRNRRVPLRNRRIALPGMALGIAGVICSHHHGVIYVGVPLLAGEAVRLYQRKRPDFVVLFTGLAATTVLLFTLPFATRGPQHLVLAAVRSSPVFWARPHLTDLWFYLNMLPAYFPLVLAGAVLLLVLEAHALGPALKAHALGPTLEAHGPGPVLNAQSLGSNLQLKASSTPTPSPSPPSTSPPSTSPLPALQRLPPHELSAAAALALLLPIMLAVTKLTTGYFLSRYACGTAMGLAMLVGLYAPRFLRNRQFAVPLAALCSIYVIVVAALCGPVLHAIHAHPNPAIQLEQALSGAPQDEPVVIASALMFLPDWWYAPPLLRSRLHYLADIPYAIRQPDFYPEYAVVLERPYNRAPVDDYRLFARDHSRFLLYCYGEPNVEWLADRLASDGFRLTPLRVAGRRTLYQAERIPAP